MGEVDMHEYLPNTCVFDRSVYESTQPESGHNGVLRVVRGPVAEWDKLNRNKRKYSEKLWDKVLASPYVQEQMRHKTLYGEAGHPTDRYEVDFGRVSHSITELWKVPASSQVYATINILDTPLGRIINTLYEAGGVIGYSSRAGGTLISKKGYVEVDENSYNFVTFDAVPFPSVEAARPSIYEGVETETYKVELPDEVHDKLCQIISESTNDGREAIKGLIYSLESYDLSREIKILEGNHDEVNKSSSTGEITLSLLKESSLQIDKLKSTNQTLSASNQALEKENQGLRESLNSSLASVTKLMNESANFNTILNETESRFNDTIRELKSQISEMEREIGDRDLEIESLESVQEAFKAVRYENRRLQSDLREAIEKSASIDESVYSENERMREELVGTYKEISDLIQESSELSRRVLELEGLVESRDMVISSKDDVISSLEDEKKVLESKSVSISESVSDTVNMITQERDSLRSEVAGLNESLNALESSARMYKDDLVSVICEISQKLIFHGRKRYLIAGLEDYA